jgi:carbon storage regulator
MLILTRGLQESIRIGDDITITVAAIEGGQVKLAFQAPEDVTILRRELLPRDREEADMPPD